ncbi:hypothetical protein CYY_009751 [Polysphondylium violaceum]|uniref:Uncharacterized protein n=1 Tax=Polysphondylium violaceum TaxID=133409 RepID=A0A8J4PLS5_9MYCE|nr:hypothetical protein CYY_009751 [Polysphondylium violaceum]
MNVFPVLNDLALGLHPPPPPQANPQQPTPQELNQAREFVKSIKKQRSATGDAIITDGEYNDVLRWKNKSIQNEQGPPDWFTPVVIAAVNDAVNTAVNTAVTAAINAAVNDAVKTAVGPAVTAAINAAIEPVANAINAIQNQLNQLQHNERAQKQNSMAVHPDSPLTPIHNTNNEPPPHFPATRSQFLSISAAEANEFLTHYGLPHHGNIARKIDILSSFINLPHTFQN